MEQRQDKLIPMTPEEVEAEAAYAEEIYQRSMNIAPEEAREIIRRHRQPKAASQIGQSQITIKP
jgi:hypothetical protein